MYEHVTFQVSSPFELFAAMTALEVVFIGMSHVFVVLQYTGEITFVVTLITGKLFPSVGFRVVSQCGFRIEQNITVLAGEIHWIIMAFFMFVEVFSSFEFFVTSITRVGCFTGMNSNMFCENRLISEFLPTFITTVVVLLAMNFHVLLEL